MGWDVVALWQHPGDSDDLWGAESLSEGQRGLHLCTCSWGLKLAGPSGQQHPPPPTPNTSPEGVINHLAPDSSSVERSHLGWGQWLLYTGWCSRCSLTNESFFSSCITIYPHSHTQTHAHTEGPSMQKAPSSAAVSLCSCLVRCPPQWL